MPFSSIKDLKVKQLAEDVELRAVSGEKMTMALFSLVEGAAIPEHSHPHEQIGTVLSGSMELIIGEEKRIVAKGDLWVIPSNVAHKGKCMEGPAEVLEFFSPVREDYA
jgi:quercetin dioxygenase-like cupin family protein